MQRGHESGRIAAASDERRNFQHHVAEDAAETGRQRPGLGGVDAAGDGGEEQSCAKPGDGAPGQIRSTPRAVTKKKPQMTAGTSAATADRPKNCMARSENTAPG